MNKLYRDVNRIRKIHPDLPAVSLYLNIIPQETWKDFLAKLNSKITEQKKESEIKFGSKVRKDVFFLLEKIQNEVEKEIDLHGAKSIAAFADPNHFIILKLPQETEDHLIIGKTFHLTPLLNLFQESPETTLVLVDRNKAKFYDLSLERIKFTSRIILSDVPQKIQAPGENMGREDKILRHIEDHLRRHFKKVVAELENHIKKSKPKYIILGGEKEVILKFQKILPQKIAKLVIGSLSANVGTEEGKLLLKTRKIIGQKAVKMEKTRLK